MYSTAAWTKCFDNFQHVAGISGAQGGKASVTPAPRGDHWRKIVEQRAIKNRVQYIHCR